MSSQADRPARFPSLHRPGQPLLLPNPWDVGSARLFASLGFEALATTSGGFAATLGRLDGSVTRSEVLDHARAIVTATDLPVSADLENAFADDPEAVAESITLASAQAWRVVRWRTSPAAPTIQSMTSGWRWKGLLRPPRPPTAARPASS